MTECTTKGTFKNSPDCTTEQKITRPQDFIAVAGSAESKWSWATEIQSEGNRYMFINQAIRALYSFEKPLYANDGTPKKQRILVVFQYEYTTNDIANINKYAEMASSRVVYVKNVTNFINFLNKRKVLNREVRKLEIYSHGVVGIISFHYSWYLLLRPERLPGGEFDKSSVDKVDSAIFSKNAEIISYACRTGIGEKGDKFSSSAAAKPENSLAQYMADKWKVSVQAFERRSLYAKTYGTAEEIKEAENYKGRNVALLNRKESLLERNKNDGNDGGPIMPTGAWHPPTSGQTPEGLKHGLQTYHPKK